jgi:hypothetical protein
MIQSSEAARNILEAIYIIIVHNEKNNSWQVVAE